MYASFRTNHTLLKNLLNYSENSPNITIMPGLLYFVKEMFNGKEIRHASSTVPIQ